MKTRTSFGKNRFLVAFLALGGSFPATKAFAVSLSVVGALASGTTSYNNGATDSLQGELGYGAGVLLDGRLMPRLGLETGGIFLSNHFNLTTAGTTTSISRGSIYVPVDLRFRIFGPFSLIGGGYFNDFTETGISSDYGWEAGLRFSSRYWFIDGRYSHGLKDQGGYEYSNVLGLFGIRL